MCSRATLVWCVWPRPLYDQQSGCGGSSICTKDVGDLDRDRSMFQRVKSSEIALKSVLVEDQRALRVTSKKQL